MVNFADSAANIMSPEIAIENPAPAAMPFTATRYGAFILEKRAIAICKPAVA